MDDDLLADDGQFKDDGLDDLDIDEEAALLGLSDEESEKDVDQELEYVDEDGNPVEIGENNAELYEVANINPNKRSTPPEDILELDLDAELDSFTQEDTELINRKSPVKTFNERQCQENLISLTSRNEHDKPSRRKESYNSPERNVDRSNSSYSSNSMSSEPFNDDIEYDEESEDENIADDHRERFKSERSNIITLTPAKKRDIPDTLESVINAEETAKVQAFLENEQKRKMRFKGKGPMRMKNIGHYPRQQQSFSNMQSQHHQHQLSAPSQTQSFQGPPSQSQSFQGPPSQSQPFQAPPSQSQSRKILVNPHFRGVRPPLQGLREPGPPLNHPPQVSVSPMPYETSQNFVPPVYSHHENTQVNISAPVFSTPPPAIPYKPPEYSLPPPLPPPPQQQHIQQAPPPIWQHPPEIAPAVSYANPPPPPVNYSDPLAPVPNYHNNYNPNPYPNTSYSTPQVPPPQVINYNQPPPPVHIPPPSYAAVTASPAQTNVTPVHFQTSQPPRQQLQQQQLQQNVIHKTYQENRPMHRNLTPHNKLRKPLPPSQLFNRMPEKRASNLNIKQVPVKQPRLELRKNVHVNNSNIREIPLVDNLPTVNKTTVKPVLIVEEEDEKTKELRLKIEEQKLLRAQILKRKEERRRQMAAQRLLDLKKRQAEQNKNVIAIQRVDQMKPVTAPVQQTGIKPKVNVKQRIGLPMSNITGKKKVVVVRKKMVQPINAASNEAKKGIPIAQRIGIQGTKPTQKVQFQKNAPNTANQNQVMNPKPLVKSNQQKQVISTQKNTLPINNSSANKQTAVKPNNLSNNKQINKSPQNKKGNILQRLGNRNDAQKQFFHRPPHPRLGPPSPRMNGPRVFQFQNPQFMEPRMRFPSPGPPLNDMQMPGPHFHDNRPPLIPFHSPRERSPFNPLMFEPNHPPFRMQGSGFPPMRRDMYPNRFPVPQFPSNQMPPMRQFEPKGQLFHRQRFPNSNTRPKQGNNANQHKKTVNNSKNEIEKVSSVESVMNEDNKSSVEATATSRTEEIGEQTNSNKFKISSNNSDNSTSDSVSVENLSSSTSEVQLRKLGSSVGVVQSIQLIKEQRKAIIKFKESLQALNFQKKYQRYMLDLAMIQVSLLV
ncbi:hypothetical protein CDAR_403523 [Caerostris darwini]|uniref:RRM domain-containing protein n=1 Tax=Caerostris darwini TaxID=1538125 RepID=A0AAV4N605_9ARAC|nr:hypothetical protein CDAR_403523 [Caerostris darwini]